MATTADDLDDVRRELQDRYGPTPPAANLLLQSARLKFAAAAADIDTIETRGEKLILSRRGQPYRVGGRFPRLAGTTAEKKLAEIAVTLRSLNRSR